MPRTNDEELSGIKKEDDLSDFPKHHECYGLYLLIRNPEEQYFKEYCDLERERLQMLMKLKNSNHNLALGNAQKAIYNYIIH